jgi:hypothetical protein
MAATTGADAISAAASRSASFRIIPKRFATDLAKIQRAHSFPVPYSFARLSEGLLASSLGIFLQPTIRKTAWVGRKGRESRCKLARNRSGDRGHSERSILRPKVPHCSVDADPRRLVLSCSRFCLGTSNVLRSQRQRHGRRDRPRHAVFSNVIPERYPGT